MTARHYYRNADGDVVELTDYISTTRPWTLQEKAEEGESGQGTIILDDPDLELDIEGHLNYWVIEDESEATDNVLFGGNTGAQSTGRGDGQDRRPLERVVYLDVTDKNAIWNRRVMRGSDNKRPAETDVERMQWLMTTNETGVFDDTASFLATGNPVNMDKDDYRRRYRNEVVDDCAQESGKNWWASQRETGSGRETFMWYGRDSVASYSSPLYLTNDPAYLVHPLIDAGTSDIYPVDPGLRHTRDPWRVYTGVLIHWKKGWIYRRAAGAAFIRDSIHEYRNVRTKARAIARATRLLAKLDTEERIVTATVILPKGKATMLRAGMRVPMLLTHIEGAMTWKWWRVLSCSITPVNDGNRYQLGLELTPTGVAADAPAVPALLPCGASTPPAGFYGPLGSGTSDANGWVQYGAPGQSAEYFPDPFHVGTLIFPAYGVLDSVGRPADVAGSPYWGASEIVFTCLGPGTVTFYTSFRTDQTTDNPPTVYVFHLDAEGTPVLDDTVEGATWGVSITAVVPNDGYCNHFVRLQGRSFAGTPGVQVGWAGLDWSPL